ncbi:MAG: aspartate-semialdehyde dehydrogenase [Planctomycetota bacterium]
MRVGIVGATGAVGLDLLAVLAARAFPCSELRLMASARSAGRRIAHAGGAHPVHEATPEALAGLDLCFFSAGAAVSRALAPVAAAHGALVVDNSSAFRMHPEVPLVVPECNGSVLAGDTRGIVANPNCSTILLCLALAPLQRATGLGRVVVSTYQAASGAGARAVDELKAGTRASLADEPFVPSALPQSLAFNLFPHVDVFQPDGFTREEDKMLYESRKILGLPQLAIEATCVRVPVERCHAEAVTVELERPLDPAAARALFAAAPGLEVVDDPGARLYPMPVTSSGRDPVAVGRVRASRVFVPGLTFWLVGDQVRKGAALNAVQIAERVFCDMAAAPAERRAPRDRA